MSELGSEPLHSIEGVEIFRVGTWNGDAYSKDDLDEMVSAFARVGFSPPLKRGHSKEIGGRAYGWVTALRRVDDKLLASFADVPRSIFKLIKERGLDAVSAEIFFDLERGGKKFRRALKAVALLGSEIPAVAGLAPLRTVVNEGAAQFRIYTIPLGIGGVAMSFTDSATAGKELDRLTKERMKEVRTLSYSEAMKEVLEENSALRKVYAQVEYERSY